MSNQFCSTSSVNWFAFKEASTKLDSSAKKIPEEARKPNQMFFCLERIKAFSTSSTHGESSEKELVRSYFNK